MEKLKLNLLLAFTSFNDCRNTFATLTKALKDADPAVAVLALEGLCRIESEVKRNQLSWDEGPLIDIKTFLRKWRRESPLSPAYSPFYTPKFLRSLTIFKIFEVPLFVDGYGTKTRLSSYGGRIENICIDGNTSIYHVTHCEEAEKITKEKGFKPSDNKNIIEGCWFGLDSKTSVYGSRSFRTELSLLRGVTGLHQGEIVSYKNEINVILYAADDANFENLQKPTDDVVEESNSEAYVKVSIFVPSRFLPESKNFWKVVSKPTEVTHKPFCVKEKRTANSKRPYFCEELVN